MKVGYRKRLRAKPQSLATVERFNRFDRKASWLQVKAENAAKRHWEPPTDDWWMSTKATEAQGDKR